MVRKLPDTENNEKSVILWFWKKLLFVYDCLILILCTEFNLKACPHRQAGTEMTSWEDKLLIKQVISSLFLCPWCHLYSCPLIRPTHLVRSLGSVHTFKQCLMDIDQVSGQTYVLLYILGRCCLARIIGYTQQQTKYQANDLICWFRLIKGPGPLLVWQSILPKQRIEWLLGIAWSLGLTVTFIFILAQW